MWRLCLAVLTVFVLDCHPTASSFVYLPDEDILLDEDMDDDLEEDEDHDLITDLPSVGSNRHGGVEIRGLQPLTRGTGNYAPD